LSRFPRLDRLLGGVDVFWAPTPAPLALSRAVPFVLTLHDLSWELRPADFTPYERLWHRMSQPRNLAMRADRVIAVSDATRDLAIARWGMDPDRIVTVPEGIPRPDGRGTEELAAVRRAYGLPDRYFLSVGALEPRKAPEIMLQAFREACSSGLDVDLVIAGKGRLAAALSGPRVHLTGHVPDAVLDALYAGALALVMPSRLEGFGLPPIEAALRGIPSIVSNLPVFEETLGEAVLRVVVDDVAALRDAMLRLATDAGLRNRLGGDARQVARRLTPGRSAAGVHAVLASAARRSRS
jgi:glycosyltransferase involved in cell wall biosynthesis